MGSSHRTLDTPTKTLNIFHSSICPSCLCDKMDQDGFIWYFSLFKKDGQCPNLKSVPFHTRSKNRVLNVAHESFKIEFYYFSQKAYNL